MSRKPRIIPPIAGSFNDILASIAMGGGTVKKANRKATKGKVSKKGKSSK